MTFDVRWPNIIGALGGDLFGSSAANSLASGAFSLVDDGYEQSGGQKQWIAPHWDFKASRSSSIFGSSSTVQAPAIVQLALIKF